MDHLSNVLKLRRLVPPVIALAFLLGCDSGSVPVAPTGTVLTVQANPIRISVTGTSAITVVALDMSGRPALADTEIRLSTTRGTIEELVRTNGQGIARASLRADGREGTATVTASSGQATSGTAEVTIGFDQEAPLVAKFNPVVTESLTVFFDDQSEGEPTSWQWNFGDGVGSSAREPTHDYAAASTYEVTLTVRDADEEDTARQKVTVPLSQQTPPQADFEAAVDGLRVTFTDKSTAGGPPSAWEWDFGDGSGSSAQNPVHVYDREGNYSVTLVTSNAAGSSSKSKPVTVPASTAPTANFGFREVDDHTILFTDSSTGGPTRWQWDFGDGGTSTVQNPSHDYGAPGVFTVVLTVGNPAGSSSKSAPVEVFGPLEADFSFSVGGFTVVFEDLSLGKPTGYAWDFGDDETSENVNPSHVYDEAGTYVVTLTVTRNRPSTGESTDSVSQTVTVE